MKGRTVLVLLALVAATTAFVFLVERDLPSSDERAERARRLLSADLEEVVALTIEGPQGRIALRRTPDETGTRPFEDAAGAPGWRLLEPRQAPADG